MTPEKFHDALTLLPSDLIAEADEMRQRKPKIIPLRRYAAMAASLALVLLCGALLTGPLKPVYKEAATEMAAPEAADMAESQLEETTAAAAPKWEPETGMEETQAAGTVTGNSSAMNRADTPAEEPAATEQELCSLPTAPAYEEAIPEYGWGSTNRYSTPFDPNSSVNMYSVPQNLVLTTSAQLRQYLDDHARIYDFSELEATLPTYDDAWFENCDLLITVVDSTSTDFTWTVTDIRDVRGIDEKGWDWFIVISVTEEPTPEPTQTNYHLLTPIEKGLISPNSSILNVYDNPTPGNP